MAYFQVCWFVRKNIFYFVLHLIFTKNDFWHYVYAKFNIFSVKYFLFKMPIWATGGFYTNTVFYSYTDYIVNDETYSLGKLSTVAMAYRKEF